MSEEMIKIDNVTYEYSSIGEDSQLMAVKDVSISVKKGEYLVILGHNGSGKSTLAKLMNGLLLPTKGNVYVNNMNTKDESKIWNIRETAGMVFQNPDNQIVATIVEEDVAFGPENLGVLPEEIRLRVDDCLKRVNMQEYKRYAPHLLSGGQKQRVAIAGVLAMRPDCIIFDESTAMLDPSGRREVMNTIKEINGKYNMTVILITHYMEEAVEANRIIVMDEGKIIMEGTPRSIFSQVRKMKDMGLDVPQMTELAYELKANGVDIRSDILTIDEMVSELCRLK